MSDSDNSDPSTSPKENQIEQLNQTVLDSISALVTESNHFAKSSHDSAKDADSCVIEDSPDIIDLAGKDANSNKSCNANAVSSGREPYSVFHKSTRIFIVAMASICCFVSPLSANIYFPALNPIAADLHVSPSLINVSVTTFMIFQGLAPSLMGNLADTSGRRPAYLISYVIYLGACIGLALQTSYPALLVLRCIQASGSSSSIALGIAVAADVATAAERGTYIGWVTSGSLVGPSIAPILGGILAQFLGWRAIFWFLVIFVSVLIVPLVLFFPETGRNVVGNGSIPPQPWNRDLPSVIRERRMRSKMSELHRTRTEQSERSARAALKAKRPIRFPNPLSTLKILTEKDVGLLLLYLSLVYSAFYSVTTSIPYLFAKIYHFNSLQVGLVYIPYGVGSFLACLLNGRLLDWRFRRVANSLGIEIVNGKTTDTRNFPLERARLPIALIFVFIGNSALLCYGWVRRFTFLLNLKGLCHCYSGF